MEELIINFLKNDFMLKQILISNSKINVLHTYVEIKDIFSITYNEYTSILKTLIFNQKFNGECFDYTESILGDDMFVIFKENNNFVKLLDKFNKAYNNSSTEEEILTNFDKNICKNL